MSQENVRRLPGPRDDSRRSAKARALERFLVENIPYSEEVRRPDPEQLSLAGVPFLFRVTVGELLDVAVGADLRAALLDYSAEGRHGASPDASRRMLGLRYAASEIRATAARILIEMEAPPDAS